VQNARSPLANTTTAGRRDRHRWCQIQTESSANALVDEGHVESEDRRTQRARQGCDSGRMSIILVMGALATSGEQLKGVDAAPPDRITLDDTAARAGVAVVFSEDVAGVETRNSVVAQRDASPVLLARDQECVGGVVQPLGVRTIFLGRQDIGKPTHEPATDTLAAAQCTRKPKRGWSPLNHRYVAAARAACRCARQVQDPP
jgi:hypothetical protein